MIKKFTFTCLIVLALVSMSSPGKAQSSNDYKFHSVFMYNFTKYIQWPSNSGDFVIGVLGNSGIYADLERLVQNRTVGSQKIVVKKFSSAASVESCNMLFIPSSQSKNLDELKERAKRENILLVTESPGMAQKGSNINFVLKDGKWKFELNEQATKDAGIRVSSELMKLAIAV
jgi:hypothetical protein